MMNRSLSRRLEYLEARMMPSRDRHFIKIQYVDPTGEVVESHVIEGDPVIRDRKRWRRPVPGEAVKRGAVKHDEDDQQATAAARTTTT